MHRLRLLSLLILIAVLVSCNKDDVKPVDGVIITLSGYENGIYELEVDYSYTIATSPRFYSTLRLSIIKNGTPEFGLSIDLNEDGNEMGFQERKDYMYTDDGENGINFGSWLHLDGSYFYIPYQDVTMINKIKFTNIDDTNIEGTFEINLTTAPNAGDHKIKIVGTFDVNGAINRINN